MHAQAGAARDGEFAAFDREGLFQNLRRQGEWVHRLDAETRVNRVLEPLDNVGRPADAKLSGGQDFKGRAPTVKSKSQALLRDTVHNVLGSLSQRESRIIALRFGLDDGRQRTLEEVGREFGVTRERIRQIESKTMAKLRHPSRSQSLRDYLE